MVDGGSKELADSIPDEIAVFIEPLAAACEIFEQVKIPRSHRVLVLGDGRLGALVAMTMRMEGYDWDGKLSKKFEVTAAQKIEGRWFLKQMRIEELVPGTTKVQARTYLEIKK